MTPSNIDTLIHTSATLLWLFAVLGACVYVVRLLAEHETRRCSRYEDAFNSGVEFAEFVRKHDWVMNSDAVTPPTGGSSVQKKGGQG